MKRTLLGLGFAVLVSLMFVPHRIVSAEELLNSSLPTEMVGSTWGHHEWLPFYKIGWYNPESDHVLWTQFVLQTVFVCVLAAIIANIPYRRRRQANRNQP
jgi:hypothetical protein